MDILRQLKETSLSVLPIGVLTIVLSLVTGCMGASGILRFLLSCILVIVGLTIFLTGVEIGITPIGGRIGSALTKSRSLIIMLLAALMLGLIITLPEPDVQVLASQVHQASPSIPTRPLVFAIALGVGIFFAISLARTVLSWPMKAVMLVSYSLLFIVSIFSDNFFISVGFDSGGATTGPLSVPFIMALGMGVATMRKHSSEANFGYVAISSIGPVLFVLIFGLTANGNALASAVESEAEAVSFFSILITKLKETGFSLLPLVLVCLLMQVFVLKTPKAEAIREAIGVFYAYIGIVLFFTGVDYSFSQVARMLGEALIGISPLLLYVSAFLFGLSVVLAEPAVIVLTEQVEEESSGRISKRIMLATLSLGVGLAVTLAAIRTVNNLPIWMFLLPGYATIMLLMIWTPGLFSAIAFDSGGVATGPMSSAFLLPLAMGAASGAQSATLSSSFGMIAMIAMMPILLIEVLGIIYRIKTRKAGKGDV